MVIGVLAFQGDFAEHIAVLHMLRVAALEVRTLDDLAKVDGLIIPGGESTVIARFLDATGVGREIRRRVGKSEHPLAVLATCAGAIVLASRVTGRNAPRSLGLIDMTIDRNAYGSQIDSFEASVRVEGIQKALVVAFIRAPKITKVGRGVRVLASHGKEPVLVVQGRVMAATFHPEVRHETSLHRLFLGMMDPR